MKCQTMIFIRKETAHPESIRCFEVRVKLEKTKAEVDLSILIVNLEADGLKFIHNFREIFLYLIFRFFLQLIYKNEINKMTI